MNKNVKFRIYMDVGLFDTVFVSIILVEAAGVHIILHLWMNGQVDMNELLAQCSVWCGARSLIVAIFIQNCTAFCAVSATCVPVPTSLPVYQSL